MSNDLYVSSLYRQSHEDFCSFEFRPTQNYKASGACHRKVKLISSSIPLTGYVFSTTSNTFQIQELAGSAIDIVIPVGNYESQDMGAILNLIIAATALTGFYSCSFSAITSKMTITSTAGPTFQVVWPQTKLAYIFGFPSTTSSYASSQTGSFAFNFTSPSYLFLRLSGLPFIDTMENHPLSVCFAVSTANTSYYASGDSASVQLSENGLPSTMKISLLQEDGSFYELKNDWSCLFRIE